MTFPGLCCSGLELGDPHGQAPSWCRRRRAALSRRLWCRWQGSCSSSLGLTLVPRPPVPHVRSRDLSWEMLLVSAGFAASENVVSLSLSRCIKWQFLSVAPVILPPRIIRRDCEGVRAPATERCRRASALGCSDHFFLSEWGRCHHKSSPWNVKLIFLSFVYSNLIGSQSLK